VRNADELSEIAWRHTPPEWKTFFGDNRVNDLSEHVSAYSSNASDFLIDDVEAGIEILVGISFPPGTLPREPVPKVLTS
jgi:hypothetical protein